MLTWINSRFASSCWFCRESVIRGDKVGLVSVALRNGRIVGRGGRKILCRRCGNEYQARMAESEESRRAAYGHAKQLGELE